MIRSNLELIERFFQAYGKRDLAAIRQVMAEDVKWTFPGDHPLGGTKVGVEEVVAFFDAMGAIMGASNVRNELLVKGINDDFVIECQHISTRRQDGKDLDQELCVLWKFDNGRITEGRHCAADQQALEEFFRHASI